MSKFDPSEYQNLSLDELMELRAELREIIVNLCGDEVRNAHQLKYRRKQEQRLAAHCGKLRRETLVETRKHNFWSQFVRVAMELLPKDQYEKVRDETHKRIKQGNTK